MQGILKPIGEAQVRDTEKNPETQTFRDRLMDKFKAHEFVRVINIDNIPFRWQSMPVTKEHVEQPDSATQRVYREPADILELEAGKSAIVEGWRAYIMIEDLFKKMIQKKPGGIKGLTNVALQEEYIELIFLGIEDPFTSSAAQQESETISNNDDIDKALGITNEPRGSGSS